MTPFSLNAALLLIEQILLESQGRAEIAIENGVVIVKCLNSIIGDRVFQNYVFLAGTGYGLSIEIEGEKPIVFPSIDNLV